MDIDVEKRVAEFEPDAKAFLNYAEGLARAIEKHCTPEDHEITGFGENCLAVYAISTWSEVKRRTKTDMQAKQVQDLLDLQKKPEEAKTEPVKAVEAAPQETQKESDDVPN